MNENELFDVMDFQRQMYEEAMGIKRFKTVDGETLMNKQIPPLEYVVEEILPYGMTIFAGDSKSGKSILTLNLCVAVSKGEKFLGYPTKQGTVLYLALEDNERRLQSRAMMMTDDLTDKFHFTNDRYQINNGLIDAMENFVSQYPDTVLIAIDVLEYIRSDSTGGNVYKEDYKDMIPLHDFANRHNLSLLIVHHTRKQDSCDELKKSSGSTGIVGAADNFILLSRPKRTERKAKLFCSGRDIADKEIELILGDNLLWEMQNEEEYIEKSCDPVVILVWKYVLSQMVENCTPGRLQYGCTATELSCAIKEIFDEDIPSNVITKRLTHNHSDLAKFGMTFKSTRTRKSRRLEFEIATERLRRLKITLGQLPEEIRDDAERDESDGVTVCDGVELICHKVEKRTRKNIVTAVSSSQKNCHAVTE